jgi:hypothetical protein
MIERNFILLYVFIRSLAQNEQADDVDRLTDLMAHQTRVFASGRVFAYFAAHIDRC